MSAADARRLTLPEVALVALGLAVLAAITFNSHIRHAGFYYDDWGVLSIVRFPAHHGGSALSALWPYYSKRPGEVVWYALVDSTLGFHASLQLILAGVTLTLEVVLVYVLARMLGLARTHTAAICALVLVFPFSDSQWLWAIMSMATLAASMGLLAVILAIRALETPARRAAALLHGISLVLLVASILSYEVFAVLGCLSGLAYSLRVGLRRARPRWIVDVLVIVVTLAAAKLALPKDFATPVRTSSAHGLAHHAVLIVRQGARILGSAAVPFGSLDFRIIGVALLGLIGVAAAAYWLSPVGDPWRPRLGRWLAIAGVGVVVAAASWAIYLPAIDYYSPGALGTGNRVNGLAGVGIVVLLYACAVLAGLLLTRLVWRARAATPAWAGRMPALTAALATIFLGAGYLHRAASDTRVWNRAVAEQHQVLSTVRALLGPLRPQRVTLYTFHHPTSVSTWVAVFRYPWDLSGGLKQIYGFRGIAGVPVSRGTRFACGAAGLYPTNNGYHRGNGAAYGQAWFIDVGGRRAVRVVDRASCVRLTTALRNDASI